MKRFFFLAVAATMAFAACNKTEVVYPEGPQEISFTAVSKVATKAPVADANFLPGDNMNVAAYIVEGATGAGNFFDGTLFNKNGGFWTGTTPRYWPLTTSKINFLAVTETGGGVDKTSVSFDETNYASAATVTLTNNYEFNQNDLMFAAGQGKHTQGGEYTSVPMVFKHALAWVNFAVSSTSPATIKVNSITLNGAAYGGTLTLTNGKFNSTANPTDVTTDNVGAEWTSPVTKDVVYVPNDGVDAAAGPITLNATPQTFGKGLLVVPGTPTSFTINYTVDSNTFAYTYDIPDSPVWLMATKYTYNVKITLNEIKITPSITPWIIDNDHNDDADVDEDDDIEI